jgi:hypothetical protein
MFAESTRRTAPITVRLTPQEYEFVQSRARLAGVSIGALTRRALADLVGETAKLAERSEKTDQSPVTA